MAQTLGKLARELKPYVVRWINEAMAGAGGGGGATGEMAKHALSGAYHDGTLADSQAPQFLMRAGGRSLTGNLPVEAGVLIDGVDISAHAANAAAHHDPATAGNGILLGGGGQQVGVKLSSVNEPGLGFDVNGGLYVGGGAGIDTSDDQVFVDLASANSGLGFDVSSKLRIELATHSGLTFSTNRLTLGTPGTLTVATVNGVSTDTHVHQVSSTSNPGTSQSLLSTANDGFGTLQLKVLASNDLFVSGFTGSGYRFDMGVTEAGKASGELDNLTVRGRLRVYELLIQQIRATNGSVFVTSSSEIAKLDGPDHDWEFETGGSTVRREFETGGSTADAEFDTRVYTIDTREDPTDDDHDLYHGFIDGDALRTQQVNWDGSEYDVVRQVNLTVGRVLDLFTYTAAWVGGDLPQVGDDLVRLGSTDTTRQGSVYLTADDSNAPYIDVVDGVRTHADWNTPGKVKVRLGKLTGITDAAFGGTLDGYGLWADNVYLRGQMVIAQGSTGLSNFADAGALATKSTVDWSQDLSGIPAPLAPPGGAGLYLSASHMGYYDGGAWRTYMNNAGDLVLGNVGSGPGLAWNQTAGTLAVRGSITITGGSGIGNLSDANLDNVSDGSTYKRVNANEKTGAGRAYSGLDSSNRLVTAVLPGATLTMTGRAAGLYMDATRMGYWNGTAWRTYMNSSGQFYFAGSSTTGLLWDGTYLGGKNGGDWQWRARASDGKLMAGEGSVVLDEDGLTINSYTGVYSLDLSVKFARDDTVESEIYQLSDGSTLAGLYIESGGLVPGIDGAIALAVYTGTGSSNPASELGLGTTIIKLRSPAIELVGDVSITSGGLGVTGIIYSDGGLGWNHSKASVAHNVTTDIATYTISSNTVSQMLATVTTSGSGRLGTKAYLVSTAWTTVTVTELGGSLFGTTSLALTAAINTTTRVVTLSVKQTNGSSGADTVYISVQPLSLGASTRYISSWTGL
jgi:hypothetical protein